ncbi:hypothetical protein [Falsiroseomonas sp. HW251]|uniref:hypothetical protein n=1 Tax=Falsiroseomonas sp. HW251 TaxID=3390998 RepID=UPI003D31F0B1
MAEERDELADARSRLENSRFREGVNRHKAENPEYAYAPRYVPTPSWNATFFDAVMVALGVAILLLVVVRNLFF